MRIVLRPMGVAVIFGAIALLVLIAFWRRSADTPPVATPVTPPTAPSTPKQEATVSGAPPELVVYADALENGWQKRGWAKVVDYANMSPIRGSMGTSIRTEAATYEAVKIYNPGANLSPYKHIVFYANGGDAGGQTLQLCFVAGGQNAKGGRACAASR